MSIGSRVKKTLNLPVKGLSALAKGLRNRLTRTSVPPSRWNSVNSMDYNRKKQGGGY